MGRVRMWAGVLAGIALLVFGVSVQADPGTEKAARAAFVKLVDAAKKKQVGQFKQMIAQADLREMEAMEKERAGLFDMMMEMIAADDPKQFKAEIKGDQATFVKKVIEQSGSQTTTVTLVREGGQWKFGKPRS